MDASLIWRALRARYRDQKAELNAIRRVIKPSHIICDIGANKGSYLFWLSRWAFEGRVVAFEPQPSLAKYLQRSFQRHNVVVEAKGVFSKTGEQILHIPSNNSPGATLTTNFEGGTKITVPVVALDEYFSVTEHPALLKIDVEGAEFEVFKGAERILSESKPLLVFECERRHLGGREVNEVFAYLHSFGYSGQFISNGMLRPISDFNPVVHQREASGRFWNDPGYCNNFVFT